MSVLTDDLSVYIDRLDQRVRRLEQGFGSGAAFQNTFTQVNIVGSDGTTVVISRTSTPVDEASVVIEMGAVFDEVYADISWDAPADESAGGYQVEWAEKNPDNVTYQNNESTTTTATSLRIPHLKPHTKYGFRVWSVNRLSDPSVTPDWIDATTVGDSSIPAPAANVAMTATFRGVMLTWDEASETDVARSKGLHRVQIATNSTFTTGLKEEFFSGTVAVFDGLATTGPTKYYGRVYTIDSSGNESGPSAVVNATTTTVANFDIDDLAIDQSKLQDLAVVASKLANDSVGNAALAPNAVGPTEIQNLAVGTAALALLAVGTGQMQNLAVTNAKVGNAAIDDAKVLNLSAGKVTFGSMSGDRITVNTLDVVALKTSSITTATITLNGGTIRALNASAGLGMAINSQGISFYNSGGTRTIFLDATTGAGTFTGTISGSTITGTSSITIGNYILTSSEFKIVAATSFTYSDARALRWVSATGGYTQARLWVIDQGNQGKATSGILKAEADSFDMQADSYRLSNNAGSLDYITIFPNGAGAPGNVILGSGSAGSQVSVSNGTALVVGTTIGPSISNVFEVHGYAAILDTVTGADVGEVFGGTGQNSVRTVNSSNSAFMGHLASLHTDMGCDPAIKNFEDYAAKGEMKAIVKKVGRPYRFRYKDGWHDSGKDIHFGLSATDFPKEAQSVGYLDDPKTGKQRKAIGVKAQAQIAIMWGAIQELLDDNDAMAERLRLLEAAKR